MMPMTSAPPDHLREFLRCQQSPAYFIQTYIQIQHAERGTIPFTLWPWQTHLLARFEQDRRIIILKARQIGVTELAGSYALWLVRFHQSKKVIAISKNDDAAGEIMARVSFSHAQLPPWLQAGPEAFDGCHLSKSNTSVLQFAHRDQKGLINPSSIQSLPATKSAGRSKSVSLLILDEWAHQLFDKEIWSGVKATAEKGQIIGVSTANGLGGVFHRTWGKAVAGQNSFTPIFLSWRRHPDRNDAWYTHESSDNEPWQLHQEYPSDPTEAFIQSGRPVFDASYLATHGARIAAALPAIEQADGLTIWEQPDPTRHYLIAVDVAEGTAQGDLDAACVYDRATWEQVAELHGRWPLEVYAAKLDALGRRYGNALLAVERNNHGHAVLLKLRDLAYPTLYHTHDELVPGAPPQPKPGWETTSKTKPLAIGDLAAGLRTQRLIPRSQALLDEALVYAYQDNGSMSAPPSYHDDLVISHAIAAHLLALPDPGVRALGMLTQWQTLVQGQQPTGAFPGAPPPEYLPHER